LHNQFRQAVASGDALVATALAHELGRLNLADALALTLVYVDDKRERFDRAAVRWHGRLCTEVRGLSASEATLALVALQGLAGPQARTAGDALAALLEAAGQADAARLLDQWLEKRRA
jgi:hypothetical protein